MVVFHRNSSSYHTRSLHFNRLGALANAVPLLLARPAGPRTPHEHDEAYHLHITYSKEPNAVRVLRLVGSHAL